DGKPQPSATVRSWRGDLDGDAASASRGPTYAIETEDDGAFGEVTHPGAAIAEHDQLRSRPMATSAGMVVKLGPTHQVRGRVVAPTPAVKVPANAGIPHVALPWVDGCIAAAVDGSVWMDRATPGADGAFEISGVPEGDWPLCATDGIRRVLAVDG